MTSSSNSAQHTIGSVVNILMKPETARQVQQHPINTNPWFQRGYESWTNNLKIGLIETIILGYRINPIWVIENEEEECQDVLDGQHRLKTISLFMENDFPLLKTDLHFLPKEYDKKYFKDLSKQDQTKIRNYNLDFNILDSSNQDEEKIDYWYRVLNHASKPLNSYEQLKTIRVTLYTFIESFEKDFIGSPVFPKKSSKRGKLTETILTLLAVSESNLITETFGSLPALTNKWVEKTFGETKSQVDEALKEKSEELKRRIKLIVKYMNRFKECGLYTGSKLNLVFIQLTCGRLCALLPETHITRHCQALTSRLKVSLFDKSDVDRFKELGMENNVQKNGLYQRHVIKYIDSIIKDVIGDDMTSKRFFSSSDIKKKLEEQKGLCALCNVQIKHDQTYEGDHIKPWCAGGNTEYENLQVVHRLCHIKK